MASIRSAATVAAAAARSATAARSAAALRPETLLRGPAAPLRSARLLRRSVRPAALGSLESLMPLHSAIASTRLISAIAVDSSCWSWLSQGRALPL